MSLSEEMPGPEIQPKQSLNDRIAYWQGIFDRIPYENASTLELRCTAAEDLDEFFQQAMGICAYKGFAVIEHEPGTPPNGVKEVESGAGNFQGFVVAQIGKALRWQVCYGFDDQIDLNEGQTRSRQTYLLPYRAEIIPFNEVEKIFDGIYMPHEMIDDAASEIVDIVNDPEFLELPIAYQKYVIDEQLSRIRTNVAEWGGVIKDVVIDKCDHVYIPSVDSQGESLGFRSYRTADGTIVGKCLGLDILAKHQLDQNQPITSRAQLVDKYAGLFLEVVLNKETALFFGLKLNQRVFVPVGNSDIEVSFLEPAEAEAQNQQ